MDLGEAGLDSGVAVVSDQVVQDSGAVRMDRRIATILADHDVHGESMTTSRAQSWWLEEDP